jgi:hypothetical protein
MSGDSNNIDRLLLDLAGRRQALLHVWNSGSWSDDESVNFLAELNRIDTAIALIPAKSLAGVAAKARVVSYYMNCDGPSEGAEIATSIVADLERLAGGAA